MTAGAMRCTWARSAVKSLVVKPRGIAMSATSVTPSPEAGAFPAKARRSAMSALLALIGLVSVIIVAGVRIGVGVGVDSPAHRRHPIRIRRPDVHAKISEHGMCLRQEHLGPGRAQKFEGHPRVAQHVGQSRVLRRARGRSKSVSARAPYITRCTSATAPSSAMPSITGRKRVSL